MSRCVRCKCYSCTNNYCSNNNCDLCDKNNSCEIHHCTSYKTNYTLSILEAMINIVEKEDIKIGYELQTEWDMEYVRIYRPYRKCNSDDAEELKRYINNYLQHDFIIALREDVMKKYE